MNDNRSYFKKMYPVLILMVLFLSSYYISGVFLFGRQGIMPWLPIDDYIPVWPPSVFVYVLAYLQWIICPVVIMILQSGHDRRRAFASLAFSLITVTLIYVVMPTYTVRPEISGTTLSDVLLRLIYSADQPRNELPSLHCFASWSLARLIYSCKAVPKWIKISNFAFSVMVLASVVLTKQHLLLDIPSAIIVFEIWYAISDKLADSKFLKRILFDPVN